MQPQHAQGKSWSSFVKNTNQQKQKLIYRIFSYSNNYNVYGYTVDLVLSTWFNNYILVKSGQIANPVIAIVDPVPYSSIRARFCLRIY